MTRLGGSFLTHDGRECRSTDDLVMWVIQGVLIGCGIVGLLCQTEVDEEGDGRRAIN